MQAFKFLPFLVLLTSTPGLGFRCLKCYNDEGCADAVNVPSIDCQEEYGDPKEGFEWSQCLKIVVTCRLFK